LCVLSKVLSSSAQRLTASKVGEHNASGQSPRDRSGVLNALRHLRLVNG